MFDDSSEFHDQTFSRLQQAHTELDQKSFDACTFTHCIFTEAQFSECRFIDCTFQDCDLSVIKINNCAFVSTRFERCKMIGIQWVDAVWEGLSPRKVDFYTCNLSYNTFIGLKLPKLHIKACIAHDADFAEADLSGADCRQTDFLDARFLHTNLTKADFTGAKNYSIAPAVNTIKQAKFSLPEAITLLRNMEITLIEYDQNE